MPDFTPNLNLEQPKRNEGYDVQVQNRNMIKIDDELQQQKDTFTTQLAHTDAEIGDKTTLPDWLQVSLREAQKQYYDDLKSRGLNVCMPPYYVSADGSDVGTSLNNIFATSASDIIYIPNGVFGTSVGLVIPNSKTVIMGDKAEIKPLVEMDDLITVNITSGRGGIFKGGLLNGNHLAKNVFSVKSARYYKMIDMHITNAKENGYLLGDADLEHCWELIMTNCVYHHQNITVPSNLIGIHVENATDSYFNELLVIGTKKAIINRGSANMFKLVHCWNAIPMGAMEVAFETHGMMNQYIGCYADTPTVYGFAFYASDNNVIGCSVLNSLTSGATHNQMSAVYNHENYTNNFIGLIVRGISTAKVKSVFAGSTLLINAIAINATEVTESWQPSVRTSWRVQNNEGKSVTMTHNALNATDVFVIRALQNFPNEAIAYGFHATYFGVNNSESDNKVNLGTFDRRFNTIYAGTGTINTSDRNHKQQIKPIDDAVLDAWADVNYTKYKFNDAVELKGDSEARWHIGVIAQDIEDVFASHGLNAFDYGILCYDEWEEYEQDGEIVAGGSIYSVRPNECMMLESALLRREVERLKNR